jgi:3-mercaptopropionate dioxygenase
MKAESNPHQYPASAQLVAAHDRLKALVEAVRSITEKAPDPADAAGRVSAAVRDNLPTHEVLSAGQLAGQPERYSQFILHVAHDGLFSVVALVWRPGQVTPIHDHVSWCVVGVVRGTELETRYTLRELDGRAYLEETENLENPAGHVCGFAPPGDIHSVRNGGSSAAMSIHVYGADIRQLGTSIRRRYDLPVCPP